MSKTVNNENSHFEKICIQHDAQGRPRYGFTVRGNNLTKFHTYAAFADDVIELPSMHLEYRPETITHADMLVAQLEQNGIFDGSVDFGSAPNPVRNAMSSDEWLQEYAQGGLTVAKGCFAGHKFLRVAAPRDLSVKLADGCFDPDANVHLMLPAVVDLKRVDYSEASAGGRHSQQWLLLAHRNFNYHAIHNDSVLFSVYATNAYQPRDNEANLFVHHPAQKLTTCTIAGEQCDYLSRLAKEL